MYSIGVDFLTARNREFCDNAELVVQAAWPHIVAKVHRFSRMEREEQRRIAVLTKWHDSGVEYVQVDGLRIYLEHVGALQDVGKSYIGKRLNIDGSEYVCDVLNHMAVYVNENLNDGQRWAYDDSLAIVGDDYFKEMRKHRKARKAELAEESV